MVFYCSNCEKYSGQNNGPKEIKSLRSEPIGNKGGPQRNSVDISPVSVGSPI
jgi:hypothetical protein